MKTCPTCKTEFNYMVAISRHDQQEICSQCGEDEAGIGYLKNINEAMQKQILYIDNDGVSVNGNSLLDWLNKKIDLLRSEVDMSCDCDEKQNAIGELDAYLNMRHIVSLSFIIYQQQTQPQKPRTSDREVRDV